MTREDIIRMAAQVEWEVTGHDFPHSDEFIEWCERFAALVAAAEREACAQAANQNYLNGYCVGRTDLLAEQAKAETVEPVAYIHETGFLVRNPAATLTAGMKLYSAPPKREPLTNREIFREYATLWQFLQSEDHLLAQDILKFARAIERAHGIGGE